MEHASLVLCPPSLITAGGLEERTETPFGWEEGKLGKGGLPLKAGGCRGQRQQGGESPGRGGRSWLF